MARRDGAKKKNCENSFCHDHFCAKLELTGTTLDKKRTIPEICGEKNAVPSSDTAVSCSMMHDQHRAKVADDLALR